MQIHMRAVAIGLVLAIAGLLPSSARASRVPAPQATYTVTDLGQLPGTSRAFAQDMNNAGAIVGWMGPSLYEPRPFLWQAGELTDFSLQLPEDLRKGVALGINDAGQIFGVAFVGDDSIYWRYSNGSVVGLPGFVDSPRDMSESGAIVGTGPMREGWNTGLLWDGGTYTELPSLVHAMAINSRGQIAGPTMDWRWSKFGWSAAIWEDGRTKILGTNGGCSSLPRDINDSGQVVGFSDTFGGAVYCEGHYEGFIWRPGGMTALGSLPGTPVSRANAVNEFGQVVGEVVWYEELTLPFFYDHGQIIDLNDLIPNSDWHLQTARDINNAGQIVGFGYNGDHGALYLFAPTEPPAVNSNIISGPAGRKLSTTATFAFVANKPGSTFMCSIDGKPFADCTSPITYRSLAQGRHHFEVQAIDAAGNHEPLTEPSDWAVSSIRIDSVNITPAGARAGRTDEWVKIKNWGGKRVSLSRWSLEDREGRGFRFGAFSLAPGDWAKIHSGRGRNTARHLYWGRSTDVWDELADVVSLKRANGTLADVCDYYDWEGRGFLRAERCQRADISELTR